MSVRSVVFATPRDLAIQLALEIARELRSAAAVGRPHLLACPAGRSALATYRALAGIVAEWRIPLGHLVVLSLDAYVTAGPGGFRHVAADLHYSCERFVAEQIVGPLNRGLPAPHRVPRRNVWLPSPDRPDDYDARIRRHGGIDLLIIASGSGDGHVGFNSPGAARETVTRLVALPESTRRDNLRTYPAFTSVDEVPAHGITMGIATMVDLSRRAVLVLPGAEKATAWRRVLDSRSYDAAWPASVVAACADGVVYADREAAAGAGRRSAP
jgi:glucosamine-6-phosphate deaminase